MGGRRGSAGSGRRGEETRQPPKRYASRRKGLLRALCTRQIKAPQGMPHAGAWPATVSRDRTSLPLLPSFVLAVNDLVKVFPTTDGGAKLAVDHLSLRVRPSAAL